MLYMSELLRDRALKACACVFSASHDWVSMFLSQEEAGSEVREDDP